MRCSKPDKCALTLRLLINAIALPRKTLAHTCCSLPRPESVDSNLVNFSAIVWVTCSVSACAAMGITGKARPHSCIPAWLE